MNDYSIQELAEMIAKFCSDREWDEFHNPKDLAIGISTEAGELLDLFRFKNEEDVEEIFYHPDKRVRVEEELADVLFFVLRFAQMNHIDLKQALEMKLEKNAKKYPVEKARGSNKKYNEFEQ
ncbi:MAG: nucleotide pyrophosphohydrolase [Lachnospiraceae bacterium]|nr:nucleotide pyrophosphohydrolase [Lachnospiraceae bacterium]